MRSSAFVRCAVLAAVATSSASTAAAGDWTLRFFGALVEPTESVSATVEAEGVRVDLASAAGAGVAVAYDVAPRWSLELGVLAARPTLTVEVAAVPPVVAVDQSLGMTPVSFGVYWSATPEGWVHLYLGPQLAVVSYDSLSVQLDITGVQVEQDVDTDVAVGALVGIDLPFGSSRWMFNATARYLETSAVAVGSSDNLAVDPFIFTAGFGVRL
jgi:outer membrane protein W